jgi:hypothetical protein
MWFRVRNRNDNAIADGAHRNARSSVLAGAIEADFS